MGCWRTPAEVLNIGCWGQVLKQCWILLYFVSEIGNSPVCENTLILEYSYESWESEASYGHSKKLAKCSTKCLVIWKTNSQRGPATDGVHITTHNFFEFFGDLFKNPPKYIQGWDRGEIKFVRVKENTSILLNGTSEQFFFFWIFFQHSVLLKYALKHL